MVAKPEAKVRRPEDANKRMAEGDAKRGSRIYFLVEKVYPSDTNFLLVKIPKASELYRYLLTQGIVVRDRSSLENCADSLRITVGTEQENTQLVDAMANWINLTFTVD